MDNLQRFALHQIMNNPDNGVKATSISNFGTTIPYWQREGLPTPKYKTPFEEILVGKYGTHIWHEDTFRNGKDLVVGRYNSETVSRLISESNLHISEKDIISDIDKVWSECDLRKTTATALPKLKEVGGTLALDTASSLESLSGLKKADRINVYAKNLKDMDDYLKKLGILAEDGKKILVDVMDNIYLFLKNYL